MPIMKKADIQEFFEIMRAQDPEPKSDLEYTNPYTLLVAVTLNDRIVTLFRFGIRFDY